ncbi:MAG: hypothetical protein A2Z88_09495 [Omnitrophica WOR_2 bacterium GWA2_47_8]|nr:MAG: hypothetical protein A2Z88_09495 [Omnitrophica WOR_2 bacterium GWA2_47_8]
MTRKKNLCRVITFFALSFWASSAFGQQNILVEILSLEPSIVSVSAENTDIFKPAQRTFKDPKTGKVYVQRAYPAASYNRQGAGVIIHELGIIATNAHIVKRADKIGVTFSNDTQVRARLLLLIENIDLALIQVPLPQSTKPVNLADSDQVNLGDEIITVGNSPALKQTISGGKIIGLGLSSKLRDQGQTRNDLLQTTVNVYGGDSGGPLFDYHGRLIGLMTAAESAADHSSFAIPSNMIKKYLMEALKNLQ